MDFSDDAEYVNYLVNGEPGAVASPDTLQQIEDLAIDLAKPVPAEITEGFTLVEEESGVELFVSTSRYEDLPSFDPLVRLGVSPSVDEPTVFDCGFDSGSNPMSLHYNNLEDVFTALDAVEQFTLAPEPLPGFSTITDYVHKLLGSLAQKIVNQKQEDVIEAFLRMPAMDVADVARAMVKTRPQPQISQSVRECESDTSAGSLTLTHQMFSGIDVDPIEIKQRYSKTPELNIWVADIEASLFYRYIRTLGGKRSLEIANPEEVLTGASKIPADNEAAVEELHQIRQADADKVKEALVEVSLASAEFTIPDSL